MERDAGPVAGEPGRSFIIAGHSHLVALGAKRNFVGTPRLTAASIEGRDGFFLQETHTIDRSQDYWRLLIDECAGRDIFITYRGNEHVANFLFAGDPATDVYDPALPGMEDGARVPPRSLIKDFFQSHIRDFEPILKELIAAGAANVVVLGTPPPKSDLIAFEPIIRRSRAFRELAAHNAIDLSRARLASARFLLKLWRILQESYQDIAIRNGARFVPVPAKTIDKDGFLKNGLYEYAVFGVTHANAKFGQMLMKAAFADVRHR